MLPRIISRKILICRLKNTPQAGHIILCSTEWLPSQGGYSRYQVMGMIFLMGAKVKTPKTPWTKNVTPKNPFPNFRALKISTELSKFGCTLFTDLGGQDTWVLQWICTLFWIPQKIPFLNHATQKNILPNFPTQKNPGIENFKPKRGLW